MEMSREDIITGLEGIRSWNSFAQSLWTQWNIKGILSGHQLVAAEQMLLKIRRNEAERAKNEVSVDVSGIKDLLEGAGLKRPVFRAAGLKFSLAPQRGANAGAVYVKAIDGDAYQGKIMGGTFKPAYACDQDTPAAILRVASQPRTEAVAHGRLTGSCSCCGRPLTDPDSISLGVGPVCLQKWGL